MRTFLLVILLSAPALAVEHDGAGRPQWTYCTPERLSEAGWFHRFVCSISREGVSGAYGDGGWQRAK